MAKKNKEYITEVDVPSNDQTWESLQFPKPLPTSNAYPYFDNDHKYFTDKYVPLPKKEEVVKKKEEKSE